MSPARPSLALAGPFLVAIACGSSPSPCPSPSAPLAVIDPPKSAAALLGNVADQASRRGADALVVIAEGVASEGDRVGGFASVPEGACVVVYARGSKGVADLDLFAFADDGSPLGADESSSADPAILLCPPLPGRVYFAARVASGSGLVAVGAQRVRAESASAVAAAAGAKPRGEETGRLESWPGLEAKLAAHRRAVGSSWQDVRRFAVGLDPRAATRTSAAVEPDRCLDVLIVPTDEVPALDVVAEDASGRVVARALTDGRDRTMVLCSREGANVTIAARPRGGSGSAAFLLSRGPKGGAPEISDAVRIDYVSSSLPVEKARAELARDADAAWGKPLDVGGGRAKTGSRTSRSAKLARGCTRLDVIAGEPLGPVSAAVWDDAGVLVSESDGALRATLYACGGERSVRVDVESGGAPGPFVIDARTWKDPPAELLKRPRAAARLLDRIAGTEVLPPSTVESARSVDLEADRLGTSGFVVAAGSCAEAIVALESGAGLDLRMVDEASGEDVTGRGRYVASQRICGGKTSRKVRLELRVDEGPGPALVLLRTQRDTD